MAIRINNVDKPSTTGLPDATSHGTYYIADNPTLYEPQRQNNFEFVVYGLKGNLAIENNLYAQDNPEEVIRLSITQCPIPHFSQEAITIKRGNNTVKYAGTPVYSNGTLTVNDYIGAGPKDVLLAWQRLSYNALTEKVGLAGDYKKQAYLLELTPDNQVVRTWKLFGCWISGLSEDSYNNEQSDKHTISATIEYDKAIVDTSDLA